MPVHRDHWAPVAQDLITHALGLTERARRCVLAADLIDPGVKVPAELAFLREPAPKRRGHKHVVASTPPPATAYAPFGFKADGVTPRKRRAPSPQHQAAMNAAGRAARSNGKPKEPAHA